jgi:4-amino-4-deoxy-L-arabinose transferase-like glycosyltransferase
MLRRLRELFDRYFDALADPRRRERVAIVTLAGYAVIWALYGVLAKASQDVQIDAAELVAWSRHLAIGYAKHPPLAAWLVHAWFSVFPVADWSYYLFGTTYSALGLWLAWHLFKDYLGPENRVVGLAMLTFVPIYNFFSLRFDVNVALTPLWAATTLCFIRSFEMRSAFWAALAGAAAAAAMLGKYWSLFLLLGLALAVLVDRRRGDYFRSVRPWITVVVGALLLAPHIVWLVHGDYSPLRYAFSERATHSFLETVATTFRFLAGAAGYMAVPVLLAFVASRRLPGAFADSVWPASVRRRFVPVAFAAPILLAALVALAAESDFNPIWAMAGFTLLPVVLLSSPLVTITRRAAKAVVGAAVAFPLLMTVVAPAIAVAIHRSTQHETAMYGKMLADRVLLEWRKQTDRPLRVVGGDLDLAYVTAFYLPGGPASLPVTEANLAPWVDATLIKRQGIALVCHVLPDLRYGQVCVHGYVGLAMQRILKDRPPAKRIEVELTRIFLGIKGRPARFLIYISPP